MNAVVVDALDRAAKAGLELSVERGRLRVRHKTNPNPDPVVIGLLAANKKAIITELSAGMDTQAPPDDDLFAYAVEKLG